ncbi:transcriptional regulator [Streptomyces yokosukanensis]|uniref:Transcriptional regulator n=1 Tax=Streptomyces yokosukanensis TaxID=67386 RepID=A0A101P773_9ACTN|nr:transcriptional regulator [Streptomyces yokosukanensis]KUN06214.1 transcriptional regulator [Streptomyces yokosukanensis]
MTATAGDLLQRTTGALAPDPTANPVVPLVERGEAPTRTLATLALEQQWVIPADRRSFEHLAQRADPASAAFFTSLATGEELASAHLEAFARACGVREDHSRAYVPLAGCQAYPAYVSWLALNASPADVVLALTANFSAWGGYCARIATGLRTHYGFGDDACAFFDFFAAPAPELERQATEAVQAGLDDGSLDTAGAHTYGVLLQTYESMFWQTVWQPA